MTIAEESTAWPGVTRPIREGGLGFTFKWNMGWMHDTLEYFAQDPLYRAFHHDQLTFAMMYEYSEHFIMPLSHDEMVHLKGSLLEKMPGDHWQKFANLRALLAYQFTRPGKKLLFMGSELAPWREWNHDQSLDWHADEPERLPVHGEVPGDARRALSASSRPSGATITTRAASTGSTSPTRTTPCSRTCAATANDHAVVVLNLTPVPQRSGTASACRRAGATASRCRATTRELGGSGYRGAG